MKTLPLALVLGLAVAGLSVSAQTVVSTSASAPVENIVASHVVSGPDAGGLGWRADPTQASQPWRDVGQMFVPEETVILDRITVVTTAGVNAAALGTDFTLTLFSFTALNNVGSATTLATLSGVTPASINANTYLSFTVPGDIQLEAGQTYGFLLHFDSAANGRTISLSVQNNPGGITVDPDGRLLTRINTIDPESFGSLSSSGASLEYFVQGTVIPEPSSVSLLLGTLCLAFVVFNTRSRRR